MRKHVVRTSSVEPDKAVPLSHLHQTMVKEFYLTGLDIGPEQIQSLVESNSQVLELSMQGMAFRDVFCGDDTIKAQCPLPIGFSEGLSAFLIEPHQSEDI